MHVHHHQALFVFGQDVDAVQLCDGAAQWPGVIGGVRVGPGLIAVGDRSNGGGGTIAVGDGSYGGG